MLGCPEELRSNAAPASSPELRPIKPDAASVASLCSSLINPARFASRSVAGARIFNAPKSSDRFAKGAEARPNLFCEKLRLFPRREVAAFVELVVMDELGIRPLCPTPRGCIDLVWKNAYGYGDGDVFRGEKGKLAFPIQTSRRDRRVRQPVERDVVEDVVSRKALSLTVEDARDERVAALRRGRASRRPGRPVNPPIA